MMLVHICLFVENKHCIFSQASVSSRGVRAKRVLPLRVEKKSSKGLGETWLISGWLKVIDSNGIVYCTTCATTFYSFQISLVALRELKYSSTMKTKMFL